MFKIRKNAIRENMNIKNSILDCIRYKQLNWHGHVQRMDQERLPRRILEYCPTGRQRKTSEFLDAGGYNRNERAGNWQLGMGRQREVEKEN
jgi:hypothetical protein